MTTPGAPLAAASPLRKRRPAGWLAPGPSPRGDQGKPELTPADDEDLSFLTGDFRIFQKKRGHRWSLDDFLTAHFAIRVAKQRGGVARAADLGCGIGSVLMMVAWALPDARATGVEAQDLSIAMARRSLDYNGLEDRVDLVHGDLREVAPRLGSGFDLVTGTPPYIPLGSGLISERTQRLPCFFETRGGLEDYCAAAASLLASDGVFVVCAGISPPERGARAAAAAGLELLRHVEVVPREGKPSLFRVFVMRRGARAASPSVERFVVRDASGELTAELLEANRLMGIPRMERVQGGNR
ncbi:MAG: methyltransferase domain-containing protein [Polyangiaceae bacterium]|nr:methyltransferase domain-containing protein [Polyangiaceae bacterium]